MRLRIIMLKATVLFALIFLFGLEMARAQSSRPFPDDSRSSNEKDERMGPPEREFAYRALIARADAEYKQNVKRASDSATLALSLQRAFKQNPFLSAAQIKNLQQIEKLAQRIRGYAGGSDDGETAINMRADLGDSLTRMADVAAQLQQEVEKTSRQVVSTKIITSANELITLVRHARNLSKQ